MRVGRRRRRRTDHPPYKYTESTSVYRSSHFSPYIQRAACEPEGSLVYINGKRRRNVA